MYHSVVVFVQLALAWESPRWAAVLVLARFVTLLARLMAQGLAPVLRAGY